MMEQGYQNYINQLNIRKQDFLNALGNCKLAVFSGTNLTPIFMELRAKLNKISELCSTDTPLWLNDLNKTINQVIEQPNNNTVRMHFYNSIERNEKSIINHNWEYGGINLDFDFEYVYSKYKKESKLDELFGEVIVLLERLLKDESILKNIKEEKIKILLSVINTNRDKSLYADEGIIRALFDFLLESISSLINIPGLKEIVNSLIELFKKLTSEMDSVKTKTQEEIEKTIQVPQLMLYDSKGMIKQLEDKNNININA